MALNHERLEAVTQEEVELIFRIAKIALEIDNGSGNFEEVLKVSSSDIDSLYVVLEETLRDDEIATNRSSSFIKVK